MKKRILSVILALTFIFSAIPFSVMADDEEPIVKINEGVCYSTAENAVQYPSGGASFNSTGVMITTAFDSTAANFASRRVAILRFDLSALAGTTKFPEHFELSFGANNLFQGANYAKIAEDGITYSIYAVSNLNDTWVAGNTMADMLSSGSAFETELIGTINGDDVEKIVVYTGADNNINNHQNGYVARGGGESFTNYIKEQINNENYNIDILFEATSKVSNQNTYLGINVLGASSINKNPQYVNATNPTYLDNYKTSIRWYDIKKSEDNKLKSVKIENGLLSETFSPDLLDEGADELQKTYKIGVIDETKDVTISYLKSSAKSTVAGEITAGNLKGGETTLKIPVTSEAGVTRTYIFKLVPASELGYTEDGKLEVLSLSYDKDKLDGGMVTINAQIKNNSIYTKKAARVTWLIKGNAVASQNIKVYDDVQPGLYEEIRVMLNAGTSDVFITYIADVSDDDNMSTILTPISDVITIRKDDSYTYLKKENPIDVYYKDVTQPYVTVSGKWALGNKGISAYIITPDVDITKFDYDFDKAKSFFTHANAVQTDENGYYGFDAKVTNTNDYKIIVMDDSGNYQEKTFYYASSADKENALKDLYEDKSKNTLKDKLSISLTEEERDDKVNDGLVDYNYIKLLALSISDFSNGVDEDEFLEILSELIKKSDNYSEFITLYEDALIIEKINSGLVEDITVYKDKANLSADIVEMYDELSEEEQKDISSNRLSKYGFTDLSEINDAFTKELLWIAVSSLKNLEKLGDLIVEYNEELGLDEFISDYNKLKSAAKKEVLEAVVENAPYDSEEELSKVFDKAVDKAKPSKEGSSGGSSSSSSSTVSGTGVNQTIDITGTVGNGSNLASDVINNKRVCKFTDLTGYEWANEAITKLFENKIIDGVSETSFNPGGTVKREEFVKLIYTLYNGTETNLQFADVDLTKWYAAYISKAVGSGIIKGISETEFGTGMGITREDMAVIIYRILKGEKTENSDLFNDDSAISDYAKDAVYFLKANNIVSGTDSGNFEPLRVMTRAEAAVVIYNIINK